MRIAIEFIILLLGGLGWGKNLFFRSPIGLESNQRWPLWASVMLTATLLVVILNRWADPAVTDPSGFSWALLFLVGGVVWLRLAASSFLLVNLSIALDALGARNRAAVWASSGALLGAGLIYCGGNVGSGDDAITTVIAALLGYALWFGCWTALEASTAISESIVIERELGAGLRLGLTLAVNGAILFRAVAGDWISFADTLADLFRKGWPAVVVTFVMAFVEKGIQKASR